MFGSTVKDYIYHIACVIVGKICFIILPKCKNSIWFFSHLMYSFKSYMLYNILFQFCLTYSGVSGLSSSNLRRFCSHDDRFHRPLITDAELRDLILEQIIWVSQAWIYDIFTLYQNVASDSSQWNFTILNEAVKALKILGSRVLMAFAEKLLL